MSLASITILFTIILKISEIQSFTPRTSILELKSNPLGISSKQDLIPIKLGISEKYPNTRIMTYIDINKDKL